MDSNSDERDPEVPPNPSPEELQEALRWLEEMSGRPNAGLEMRDATTEFPIQGLIDDQEGDLPDWLRETSPTADSPLTNDGELESRLDWLAKMAERESIEELPTLEWRQLTDAPPPADDEVIEAEQDTQPPTVDAEELPVEATPVEPLSAQVVVNVPTPPVEEPETSWELPSEADTVPPPPLLTDETVEDLLDSSPAAPMTAETLLDSLPPDEELPPINDLDAAMAWIEELAASQDAPVEDVPSVADRALTSKLLMEAGLSPDELGLRAPGSDLALGDLSLLEGNTPINAFVAEEDFADTIVLVETMAAEQGRPLIIPPSEPEFVPATTVADEVSFDDAMAFLDELAAQEPLGAVTQPIEPIKLETGDEGVAAGEFADAAAEFESFLSAPDEAVTTLTDDEAVALLDEALADADTSWAKDVPWGADETPDETEVTDMTAAPLPVELVAESADAFAEQPEWRADSSDAPGDLFEPTVGVEALDVEPAELPDESAAEQPEPSIGDALLEAEMAPLPMPLESAATSLVAANGDHADALETRLRAVDALALPPGTSLAELDLSLQRSGARPVRRDLPAAVEWLELALGISVPTPPPTPTDEDLVARMPDDPDAVLAWLEQMAEEDTVDSSPQLALADAAPPTPSEAFVPLERSGQTAEPLIEELSEDDLLSMPEDPDAVMAWLEGLAGGGLLGQREVVSAPEAIAPEAIAPPVAPLMPEQSAEPPATVSRSRRRRGRKSQRSAQPQTADEAQVKPMFTEDVTIASPEVAAEEVAYSFEEVTIAPPEVTAEEVDFSFEEVIVAVAESGDELPEATVGAAVEEDGLLVWPAADELPDVPPLPATPLDGEAPQVAPPVAAGPRRRGRKPKSEAVTTTEAPILVVEAVETTADQSADEAPVESSGEAAPQPPAPEATPPAKPASWVDLLKPLR